MGQGAVQKRTCSRTSPLRTEGPNSGLNAAMGQSANHTIQQTTPENDKQRKLHKDPQKEEQCPTLM